MKRIYKVYKKTVSIVNETPMAMYENLVGSRKGFLLESYDKNYDRYTFFGGTGGTDLLGGGVACHHKKERGARGAQGQSVSAVKRIL